MTVDSIRITFCSMNARLGTLPCAGVGLAWLGAPSSAESYCGAGWLLLAARPITHFSMLSNPRNLADRPVDNPQFRSTRLMSGA